MSVGLYEHPFFGLVKRYVHNNKYVMEANFDNNSFTEPWAQQLRQFRENQLKKNQWLFYLLPDETFLSESEHRDSRSPKRVVIYDSYMTTLGQQITHRKQTQQRFELNELWYFLCALTRGALEYLQIDGGQKREKDINPSTILLNQYGYIKMLGYYSSPNAPSSKLSYRAAEFNIPTQKLSDKWKLCLSVSIGRIMASLILLKDMDEYYNPVSKAFKQGDLQRDLAQEQSNCGLLYKFVKGLLLQDVERRITLTEVKAMLMFNSQQILSLGNFRMDMGVCKMGLMKVLLDTP